LSTEIGREHEDRAAKYFADHLGGRVLARNFRIRSAEIDLIAEQGGDLVFIEVRYRRRQQFGSGLESVDGKKRGRIERAARCYLERLSDLERRRFRGVRFDVLVTEGERVYHLKDAWRAP